MPQAKVAVAPNRRLDERELFDALQSEFGSRYDIDVGSNGYGDPRGVFVRNKEVLRAIYAHVADGGTTIELSGSVGSMFLDSVVVMTFFLILPPLIWWRITKSSWEEMGEEVQTFLERQYCPAV